MSGEQIVDARCCGNCQYYHGLPPLWVDGACEIWETGVVVNKSCGNFKMREDSDNL